MEFTACYVKLMSEIIYRMWRISLLCRSGSYWRQKV